jgi:hypothetical protein
MAFINDNLNREFFLNHKDREDMRSRFLRWGTAHSAVPQRRKREHMYENLSAFMTFAVFEVFAVFVHHLCCYV